MRKTILSFVLLTLLPCVACAETDVWTLGRTVKVAQDSVIQASKARHDFSMYKSEYDEHMAGRDYQLSLRMAPNYTRQQYLIDKDYWLEDRSNSLSLNTELRLDKQITQWGGSFYAATQAMWNWLLPGSALHGIGKDGLYASSPIRVGYRQELFGFNGLEWEHTIQQHRLSLAESRMKHQLAEVSEESVRRFFKLVQVQADIEVLETNIETANKLYDIGKEKFDITSIRKDEMLSLELELRNLNHSLNCARVEYNNARHEFLSYLNIPDTGQTIVLQIPDTKSQLSITEEEAMLRADANNPDLMAADEKVIEAERDLQEAKVKGRWLRTSVDFTIGMQQRWNFYDNAGLRNYNYAMGGLTLTIPIYDGGLAKSRIQKAAARYDSEMDSGRDIRRVLHDDIRKALNNFTLQQRLLHDATETVALADETFQLCQYNYANGLTDISTFTLARNRKDVAHNNYIANLRDYWQSYYELCRLTVHEW